MAATQISDDTIKTGAQLVGEGLLTGSSHLLNNDVREFALHAVLGLAARAAWGLPGAIAISANSFVKARTGQHIHEHLLRVLPPSPPAENERPPATKRSS